MSSPDLSQLAAVFQKITDPRHKRGVRHPFAGRLALVFLGTLAEMTEIAVIRRWAHKHWKETQSPLGFTRKTPAATTISRTLAQYSVEESPKPSIFSPKPPYRFSALPMMNFDTVMRDDRNPTARSANLSLRH